MELSAVRNCDLQYTYLPWYACKGKLTDFAVGSSPPVDALLVPIDITVVMAKLVVSWPAEFCARLVEIVEVAKDPNAVGELSCVTLVSKGMPSCTRVNDP